MNNKSNYSFAAYLAENVVKENIISEIFKNFNVDCITRCQLNPSTLDNLIKKFNECDGIDISVIDEIITFIKTEQQDVKSKEKELLQSIKTYIDETYMQDISNEKIAKELHISYYYMCHIFKDNFNISISTYRTQKRLENTMKLLLEGDNKVSDIALSCGFNSISYFTETFTKYIGITPTAFKEQNKNLTVHEFYGYNDILLATKMDSIRFLDEELKEITQDVQSFPVCVPDERLKFLHESAIIEYHNTLYASWYHCPEDELQGYTPICGKRSSDGGKTWSDL